MIEHSPSKLFTEEERALYDRKDTTNTIFAISHVINAIRIILSEGGASGAYRLTNYYVELFFNCGFLNRVDGEFVTSERASVAYEYLALGYCWDTIHHRPLIIETEIFWSQTLSGNTFLEDEAERYRRLYNTYKTHYVQNKVEVDLLISQAILTN